MKYQLIIIFSLLFLYGCATNKNVYIPQRDFSICSTTWDCAKTIQIAIQDNWSRPKSATNNLEVWLYISISQKGTINSINIAKTSGNSDFDMSTVNAVEKAAPFSEIEGLSEADYNKDFNRFKLVFKPKDLPK